MENLMAVPLGFLVMALTSFIRNDDAVLERERCDTIIMRTFNILYNKKEHNSPIWDSIVLVSCVRGSHPVNDIVSDRANVKRSS